ncbi:Chitin bind 4 domain containing protein, partial [Asbolus verrucosus]
GTYSVVGGDGVNRIGDYTTDDLNRFNGVREERAADEPPTSTSSPSTVSEHDEQSSEPAKPSSVPAPEASHNSETLPQYNFTFNVSDPQKGDVKSHQDDDVVEGTYSVVGVDGVNRIGDYTTDDLNSFNGVVREERAADELPTSTSSPSTVSEHDEQSSEPAKPSSIPAPETSHNSENLPQYNFTFNVSDPQKGDVKSHQDDDAVEGSYSVVGVDGVKRIAAYAVDGRNGFNGVVGEERAADELPSPTSSPSTAPESHHHEKSRPKPSSAPAPEASHNSESLPQHNFAFNVSDPDIEDVKSYQDGDVLEGSYSV